MTTQRRRWERWLAWGTVLGVTHLVLLGSRDTDARQAHVALIFLLVVLGGSASGERGLGGVLATASFFLINLFYQQPYGSLSVDKPLDWIVLAAFVATAMVATELVQRARDEAVRADARAEEVLQLTAEAQRAAALEHADRLKDALLASVSHDLRTPLTTIRVLAAEISDTPDAAAREIVVQVDRLDRMVRDVLDYSRVRAGAFDEPQINTAEDLIGAALRQLSGVLRGRTVRATSSGDEVLIGRFDFASALRALSNLIDNAARYSGAADIDVTARMDGGWVAIDVADRGPGLPAGEEQAAFLPFYRPAGSPPDAGRSGLGLAIARQIAEGQSGSVSYMRRPGGGSIFTLRLPAAGEGVPAGQETAC